jgi:ABC-2 type transport system ATP-binding protein
MGTADYLRFRGRMHGLRGPGLARAVGTALRECDLDEVKGRRIGHLSRGYRQRVGLAAAILHDPPVLVLDEPTSALDPKQIRQIRGLIRRLARTKAVLVSSHILPEVEQTCDRVVIMARGRVLAEGTPEKLVSSLRSGLPYIVEVKAAAPEDLVRTVSAVQGVARVSSESIGEGWVRLRVEAMPAARDLREDLGKAAGAAGAVVRDLHRERAGLERVFLELMEEPGGQEAA